MKAPAVKSSAGFDLPDGMYDAVCNMVIDCGYWDRDYMGERKSKRELYIRFELPEVIIPDGDYAGERACVGARYTFSMHPKSNLRKSLETWRGKPFTDEQANQFEIDKLVGANVQLQLYRNDAGYTNINLMLPSKEKHAPINSLVFDTENPVNYQDLPEWIQKKIHLPERVQYEVEQRADHRSVQQEAYPVADDFDDDIPF